MHIYFGFGAYGKDAYGMSLGALFASRVTCILKPRFLHILYTFGIHSQRYSDSLNTTCIHTHTQHFEKKRNIFRCFIWLDAISWNRRRILYPQCTLKE